MYSKKINQLATNLNPQNSDLIPIGDPTTGQLKTITYSQLIATAGITSLNGLTTTSQTFATGTSGTNFNISSVGSTHTFNFPNASATNRGLLTSADWTTFNSKQDGITLTTTGSSGASTFISNTLNIPTYTISGLGGVPTTTTLTINGTTQDLSANRTFNVGTVTSVGISMPSAFTVTNSPVTSSGTLTVTGAGTASQYIRGDGQLGDFPEGGTGGGASVSYYLNGSVNQGTFGGNTYYEVNKSAIIGSGTDFSRGTDGYIAQFITDANDPNVLLIPSGNWNLEFYFSASSGGGTPNFYVELYKYDGTNFTLIASNSTNPELIAFGTTINPYFSSLAVPETALAVTDRLAIRIYVATSGRTITLHTENSHLCQIITTFTTGLTAINGLTKQVQYFATGSTGTDFNISSSVDTHTFNLPTASATNRGALSSSDWSTFNSKESALTFNSPLSRSTNTISIPAATSSVNGYLTSTDWSTFNSKQDAITLTTTGTSGAATLVGSTLNIPQYGGGGAIGGTVTGGTAGSVLFINPTSTLAQDNTNFYWDDTNNRLGIGINTPGYSLDVSGTGSFTGNILSNRVYVEGNGTENGYVAFKQTTINSNLWDGTLNSTSVGPMYNYGVALIINSGTIGAYKGIILDASLITATNTRNFKFPDQDGTLALTSNVQTPITLTTTGTSGAATFTSGTLNIPQYQAALTNPITGTATSGQVAYFNGSTSITGSSGLVFDGTNLGIGIAAPSQKLTVNGDVSIATILNATTDTDKFLVSDGGIIKYRTGSEVLSDIGGQGTLTLTTTGTSGAATLVGNTLNIPQYSGGGSMAIGGTVTSGTTGSILFINPTATLAQDNANLFWDDTNNRLGIGTNAPSNDIHIYQTTNSASAIKMENPNAGTNASQNLNIFADATAGYIQFQKRSSTHTATGIANSSSGLLYNSAGDLIIGTGGATSWIRFATNGIVAADMNLTANGRLLLGTSTESTYLLDVNGTGRYQDNLLISKNQNATTSLEISNTTSGTSSQVSTTYTSDASSGVSYFGKLSTTYNTYKIFVAKDTYILNTTGGDIAILNDFASGTIKFAAGGSSTAQAVIKTTGQLQLNNYTSTSSFTGTAAGYLAFDSSGNILSAAVPSSSTVTFNRQTSSYTLALSDAGKMVEMNVGTANNLTVPLNSSIAFPIGTQIDVTQYGAGQTTFVATAGVTIRSNNGWLKMNAQYGAATLVKVGTDEWYLFGNINA